MTSSVRFILRTSSPFLSLLLLGSLLGLQCTNELRPRDSLNVSFQETLRLGTNDSTAASHHLFSDPSHVAVGEDGSLFVVDRSGASVWVYDEEGTFQRSLGKQGNGPGEFQRITALHIDDDRLLVADQRQARITALSPTGSVQNTYQLSEVPRIGQITDYANNQYIVVGVHNDHFVHVVDSTFQTIQSSLVSRNDVKTTDHKLETVATGFFPGHVAVPDEDRILYVPSLYPGTVYEYSRTDTSWTQTGTYRGHGKHDPPVTFTPLQQADRVDLPLTLQEGRYAAQFHSISWALTDEEDGTITHVFSQERGNGMSLTLERFSAVGALPRGYRNRHRHCPHGVGCSHDPPQRHSVPLRHARGAPTSTFDLAPRVTA
jgi:hypothetical protein